MTTAPLLPAQMTSAPDPSTGSLLAERARHGTSSVIRDLLRLVDRPDMLSLAGGLPAPELLPAERLAAAAAAVMGERALQYAPTEGMVELRDVIAARRGVLRESVVVTTGSQQAVDLVARSLIDPGDLVVVEESSYLGSLQSFRAAGSSVLGVGGDADGLRTAEVEALLERGVRPKVVSVVTDFANPTGATMSLERRRHLAALADRFGFMVVEDNPYGELRWTGEPVPPIAAFTERCVSLGSASKILAPGLRLGWLSGPGWLVDAVVRAKQSADLHTSSLDQLMVAEVLSDTSFMATHLDRARSLYRHRCAVLAGALEAEAGSQLEVRRPDGGMFLWCRLADGASSDEFFTRALDAGVAVVPGTAFAATDPAAIAGSSGSRVPGGDALRLCFTTLGDEDLCRAAARLGAVIGHAGGADGPLTPRYP